MSAYYPPVNQLLALGEPAKCRVWTDYREHGLATEHIPDLIRMLGDRNLLDANFDSAESWAPTHAWRALGDLRAEAAVPSLLDALEHDLENEGDWCISELPDVLVKIGPACIPALAAYLAETTHDLFGRGRIAYALGHIARAHPSSRTTVVEVLSRQLDLAAEQDSTLNGLLVIALLHFEAVETSAVIERAFADGDVDESLVGSWERVRWELNGKQGPMPAPIPREAARDQDPSRVRPSTPKAKERAAARRKMAKKSRKRNRSRN